MENRAELLAILAAIIVAGEYAGADGREHCGYKDREYLIGHAIRDAVEIINQILEFESDGRPA